MREVFISILVLLAGEVVLLLRVSCPFLEDLVERQVLSPLGYDVLSLALAHLLSHLDSLCLWVIHFRGHEGFRLGLLDDLDSQLPSGSLLLFDWLSSWDLGLAWLTLFLLLLGVEEWHGGVALDWLLPVVFVHPAIRLRHYLSSLGSAPLVACWGLLLGGSVYKGRAISSSEVG